MNILLQNDIISLRAVEPEDLELFFRWENDTELWNCAPTIAPFSRKNLSDYIERYTADIFAERQLRLMVIERESGATAGTVDLTDFDPVNRRAAVGVLIDREFRRRGLGLEALKLTADYAAQRIGMHQLWATVAASNLASLDLFSAAGFRRYGRLRSWIRTGRHYSDAYIMQLLFSD